MSVPKRHHYVAQFLLERWRGPDGKLAVYSWKGERLVVDRHSPKHIAYQLYLYTIHALPEKDRQWVERELMGKAVDEPASKVLKRLLSGELSEFNSDDLLGPASGWRNGWDNQRGSPS